MLKKGILVFFLILFILIGIMAVNAFRVTSLQLHDLPEPVMISLNEVEIIQRFAKSITFETHILPDGQTNEPAFEAFHTFLQAEFPNVFSQLEVEYINKWTLLISWKGKNEHLAPVVLMGHQDVVPAEDLHRWTHPPFAGVVEDGIVWGRGAIDNKNNVMALLETTEYLLENGFQPNRTILFSFGHDEETSGLMGAQAVVSLLQERGVRPFMVLDEGGMILDGVLPIDGPVAFIATAEKGYLSLRLVARSQGGHSSSPPAQTPIGMLAEAVYTLEKNPFPSSISGATEDMFTYLNPELSFGIRMVTANRWLTMPLLRQVFARSPSINAMVRTTVAPTMMSGSQADNVLPTEAEVVINFRIIPGETSESVITRVKRIINNEMIDVELYNNREGINPSPVSDAYGDEFRLLQTTIRQIYPDATVIPMLLVAATDSRYFSAISDNVFRFTPVHLSASESATFHAIDEHLRTQKYLDMIQFYQQFIRNIPE